MGDRPSALPVQLREVHARTHPHGAAGGLVVAPLGMRFYDGAMFPPEYRQNIFVAQHGSWNRSVPDGYRIITVTVADGAVISSETFMDGWLVDGEAWGRPVDVEVMPDGALLVSDDRAGLVYRVTYQR